MPVPHPKRLDDAQDQCRNDMNKADHDRQDQQVVDDVLAGLPDRQKLNASDDQGMAQFLNLLERTLSLLVEKVYGNTLRRRRFAPYRQFLLHIDRQEVWLKGNIESILNQGIGDDTPDSPHPTRMGPAAAACP